MKTDQMEISASLIINLAGGNGGEEGLEKWKVILNWSIIHCKSNGEVMDLQA